VRLLDELEAAGYIANASAGSGKSEQRGDERSIGLDVASTTLPLVSDYLNSYEFSGQRVVNTCASTFGLPEFFFATLDVESSFGTNLFGTAYDHPTNFFFATTMQGVATYPHWSMLSAQCELQSIGLVWCASVELAADDVPAFGQQVAGAMNLNFTFFDGTPDCLMGYGGYMKN
jgi:hypothetical protein